MTHEENTEKLYLDNIKFRLQEMYRNSDKIEELEREKKKLSEIH